MQPVLAPRPPVRNLFSSNVWLNGARKVEPLNHPSVETSMPSTTRWTMPLESGERRLKQSDQARSSFTTIVFDAALFPLGLITQPLPQGSAWIILSASAHVLNSYVSGVAIPAESKRRMP